MSYGISLVAVIALATNPAAAPTSGAPSDCRLQSERSIDARALDFMAKFGVPGMAIGITRDGEQRFYTYGVASRETRAPVTADTLFELGSISKTFSATLATYAQGQGLLSLTDSVGEHVPELKGSPIGEVKLWQLATHSAGGFPLQFPETVLTDAQAYKYYREWKPSYAAGTQRTYANPSIALLGVAAANSMEQPFSDAIESTLLPMMKLRDTWIRVPAASKNRYAQGYNSDDLPVRLQDGPLAAEAYGVKSTARDMLAFIEQNISANKGTTPLEVALHATQVGYFDVGPMTQSLVWERYELPVSLGHLVEGNSPAVSKGDHATKPLPLPSGSSREYLFNKTGGTGGFGAYALFIPSQSTGIVVLANKSHSTEARVRLAYSLIFDSAYVPRGSSSDGSRVSRPDAQDCSW